MISLVQQQMQESGNESILRKPEYRCIIQSISEDGTAEPTHEELERHAREWDAEGIFDPMIITISVARPTE